jgi:pilus assembly protein Flp/PilA
MRGDMTRQCFLSPNKQLKLISQKENAMRLHIGTLYSRLQSLLSREEGQDLVEYALVVALVALGAVAAMNSLATEITAVFGSITSSLTSAVA